MDGSVNRGEYHENAILLNPEEFLLLWDALPDGGSFICCVSKIPPVQDLSRHLHFNHFIIASDGPNAANHLRTVHFYASVQDSTPVKSNSTGRRFSHAQLQFFLGEFIFDSLSLKLFAKFRCPQQDAIVPFVKKLQLKEIVGSYAPCE
jgi:hypothetical protein|uniref:Uncharacterized protein n=1 Tax=Globisporangium ultimum (strain ATCC 200006 / CBS 805.95 / DAOM BR144) TaxID=431595 RepID=K3WZA6_GLOUD